jgi:hypothetical protein
MTVKYENKGKDTERFFGSYSGTIRDVHWYTYGYEGCSFMEVFFSRGHHLGFVGVDKTTFERFMGDDSPSIEILFNDILPNHCDSWSQSSSSR